MTNNPKSLKRFKWVVEILGPSIIAALAVIAGVVLGEKRAYKAAEGEVRAELKKEMYQAQAKYLQNLRILTELGERLTSMTFHEKWIDQNGELVAEDNIGITRIFLSVINETETKSKWTNIAAQTRLAEDVIDPDIYLAFKDLVNLVDEYPWPTEMNVSEVEKSGWAEKDRVGRWLMLNKYLVLKLDKYKFLEE